MRVLYLSYDGLLDPLGQSQILPYLTALRGDVSSMRIISFEKEDYNAAMLLDTQALLSKLDISWSKRRFTPSHHVAIKFLDVLKFFFLFTRLYFAEKPDVVHARGHPMAIFSACFKYIFNFKLIFDYRGIWADERVAKGGWNLNLSLDRLAYRLAVKLESFALIKADHLVLLTEAVKKKVLFETAISPNAITVIPCACDYNLFTAKPDHDDTIAQPITLGYLGSIGPAYLFDRYLEILKHCLEAGIACKGLVVTNNLSAADNQLLSFDKNDLAQYVDILKAERKDIPALIHKMDVLLSFYTPFKSIIGTSPVKIAEVIACGVPIIANTGIGDTDDILAELQAGISLKNFDKKNIAKAVEYISSCRTNDFSLIRIKSRKYYDLAKANKLYRNIYLSLSID
jgi:glycosyltransferase involved in cell wall biosynthesis